MTSYEQRLSISLLHEQNEGCPLFQLPVELIFDILLLAVADARVDVSHERWHWLAVTHVCHRLREISLFSPMLWSTVQASHYRLDNLGSILQRSASSPLDLTLTIDRAFLDKCAHLIQLQLHRVRALKFGATSSDVVEEFYHKLAHTSAPLLEELDIESLAPLPPRLFNGHTPLLRTLSLYHTRDVDWHYPLFSYAHLEFFYGVEITFTPLSSGSDVFDMLTALAPSIKDIDLMYLVEPLPTRLTTTDPPSPFHQLTLPQLVSLCLYGDAIATSYVISHIIPTHPVELDLSVDISDACQLNTILSWITHLLRCGPQEIITSVDVTHQSLEQYLHFELGPTAISLATAIDAQDQVAALRIMDAAQVAVCKALPLQHVQSLSFEVCPSRTSTWIEAYGGMKQVEEVTLRGSFAYKLFYALLTQQEVLMPKLNTIIYGSLDFEESVYDDSEGLESYTNEDHTISDVIFRCMSFRKKSGVPVHRLELDRFCNASEEALGRLRDVVTEVYLARR